MVCVCVFCIHACEPHTHITPVSAGSSRSTESCSTTITTRQWSHKHTDDCRHGAEPQITAALRGSSRSSLLLSLSDLHLVWVGPTGRERVCLGFHLRFRQMERHRSSETTWPDIEVTSEGDWLEKRGPEKLEVPEGEEDEERRLRSLITACREAKVEVILAHVSVFKPHFSIFHYITQYIVLFNYTKRIRHLFLIVNVRQRITMSTWRAHRTQSLCVCVCELIWDRLK